MTPKKFCIYKNVKFVVKSPMLGKRKQNFVLGLIIIEVNLERLEKVIEKFLRNYFALSIVLMVIVVLKIGIL